LVPEKLGRFRKYIVKVGKWLYWKFKIKKMDLLMLSSMAYCVTKKYEEIFEGDTGLAIDTFTEQFKTGAQSIMMELLETIKIFFSKSLEDTVFLARLAVYIILGPKWNIFFGEPILIPAEKTRDNVTQLIIKYKKCVLCTGLRPGIDIDPNKFKQHCYGELLAEALTSLLQMVHDYVGNDYNLVVKETKCQLRGDPYGEFYQYFYPKKHVL
jgi:hypothetical protein